MFVSRAQEERLPIEGPGLLGPLYAVKIHNLQRQLAQEVQVTLTNSVTEAQLEHIQKLLDDYTSALRDFELIHANRWHTFFVKDIAASRIDNGPGCRLQAALMQELELTLQEPRSAIFSDADLLGSFDESLLQQSPVLGRTRGSQRAQDESTQNARHAVNMAWRRFIFALLGGLAIILPAVVIAMHKAPAIILAMVSASILVFACVVALFSSMLPENVLAATAAYAAVLMGFVGNYA
ncbi:MAG: hypothetical protein Q9165_008125 [Trypethelium subeluteriae]